MRKLCAFWSPRPLGGAQGRSLLGLLRRNPASQEPDIVVDIPADVGVADVFLVSPTGVVDVDAVFDVAQRTVTLPRVALDNTTPTRLFVLAGDADVRADVTRRLAGM